MSYKLYCNGTDITDIAGNIEWGDSVDTLGAELNFSRAKASDNKYISSFTIKCGDIIIFKSDKILFTGIVVTKNINGLYEESYNCFDFLFYLNKNKIIKQIQSESAENVIKNICNEFNIALGSVPNLSTQITSFYYESSVAEIIEDVLEKVLQETGKTFYLEIDNDKVNIFEKGALDIVATYKPADNVAEFDITKAIGKDFSHSYSIDEMKNSIIVVSSNDENVYTLATKKDNSSISKYGLLQEVYSIDEPDNNRANNIAEKLLAEYNVINETVNISLIGNDNVRSGRVLTIDCDKTNLVGRYFIKSCTHTLTKQKIHTMELELEVL